MSVLFDSNRYPVMEAFHTFFPFLCFPFLPHHYQDPNVNGNGLHGRDGEAGTPASSTSHHPHRRIFPCLYVYLVSRLQVADARKNIRGRISSSIGGSLCILHTSLSTPTAIKPEPEDPRIHCRHRRGKQRRHSRRIMHARRQIENTIPTFHSKNTTTDIRGDGY